MGKADGFRTALRVIINAHVDDMTSEQFAAELLRASGVMIATLPAEPTCGMTLFIMGNVQRGNAEAAEFAGNQADELMRMPTQGRA